MSRYVDLNGLTWDGTPITSKIQEVKTKSGYMQGITTGWLWGDNVPHIDLADHDKQIINKYRDKVKEDVSARLKARKHYLTDDEYEYEVEITRNLISALDYFAEQMKGE